MNARSAMRLMGLGLVTLAVLGCHESGDQASLRQDGDSGLNLETRDGDDVDVQDTALPPDGEGEVGPRPDADAVPDVDPGDVDPGDVDPGDVDPGDVDPGDVDPGDVDPGDVDPGDVDPGDVDPGDVDPGDVDLGDVDPGDVDPGDVDPGDADPGDAGPGDTTHGDTTGPPCPLYQKRCGDVCVNTNVDPAHCGDCDTTCDSPLVCSAGGCQSGCLSGLTPCEGTCVDTQTDPDFCGSCFTPCPPEQGCAAGACAPLVTLTPPSDCADFPPIVVDIGGNEICLGEQAQTSFTWGICSCAGFSTNNEVMTDAYDSRTGPYLPGGTGGGLGVNGSFAGAKLTVGGTLWSASTAGASFQNTSAIAHELHVNGNLATQNTSSVGQDAFIRGNINASSGLSIIGRLFQPPGATVSSGVTFSERITTEPVVVPPPCRCDPEEKVPVAALVDAHAVDNENAVVGLEKDALINPPGAIVLALPCGRYYLDGISTSSKLTIIATGRTALFIGGNITSSNEIQITVAPGAELDVFVKGTFDVNNRLRLGSANFPAMMRVYIGSTSGLSLNNNALIGAYVYAANGLVTTNNQFEIYGGLFAGSFSANNRVTVHYDRAILGVGRDCEDPTSETCDGCADCGNQACIDGFCGACTSSADCCSPLVCVEGQCLSLGIILD